ncbi:MAG: hypothetical protein QOI52_1472, partial [Chloroflexota bacterium]|nr:hypothetical protein [Chloroflexota bacterium]
GTASGVGTTAATPRSAPSSPTDDPAASSATDAEAGPAEDAGPAARVPAVERRRSAEALVGLWSDVARDLALSSRGLGSSVRDLGLLDETNAQAARLDGSELDAFLDRLGRAAVLLVGNVSPELVLDDLALAWPRPHSAAA